MSFDDELTAFRAYATAYPDPILLVDTYDTLTSGLPNALTVFEELRAQGRPVRAAVRLDSGDLSRLSKAAHRMFTEAGFANPLIVASNELNEDLIVDLKRQGAPINSWGVGTHLITSSDWPALGGVYKLVAVKEEAEAWQPRIKLSSNPAKMTDPGHKRLVRYRDAQGRPLADLVELDSHPNLTSTNPLRGSTSLDGRRSVPYVDRHDLVFLKGIERAIKKEELLQPVMLDGERIASLPSLEAIRARAQQQVAALPEEVRRLRNPEIYTVGLSPDLAAIKLSLAARTPGVIAPGPAAHTNPGTA
jgi:nicotinate phosphoribosyltransferase